MGGEGTRQLPQTYEVKMRDGTVWGVPVMAIARNRAAHYAKEFGGDVERSLAEDTVPLFTDANYEISDWARNNMDWSDVEKLATKLRDPPPMSASDMQEAWVNGENHVTD
jgi:hypothetical protein